MTTDAYPLRWPVIRPRTRDPKRSAFAVSMATARDDLLDELHLMRARDIVISTNVRLRRDGLPYANEREPVDSGVAVYFIASNGAPKCFAVDRWDRVKDNVRAIGLIIGALRGIDRWGNPDMVDSAFDGFEALPPGDVPDAAQPWWEVLGVSRTASLADIRPAYLALAKRHHPDAGGDADTFRSIQDAWSQAQKAWGA